jgi:hypothetical protein
MLNRVSMKSLLFPLFLFPHPTLAEEYGATLEPYLDHWFFSSRSDHAGFPRLFYQVCNRSDGNSAFSWEGAGFGVRAFAELPPNFCAFKNTYSHETASPKPHIVQFQGGNSGKVITWSIDRDNSWTQSVYTSIEASIFREEGTIDQSMISMEMTYTEDGAKLIISSSGYFSDVVIDFPESEIDPTELLRLVENTVSLSSMPLGELISEDDFGLNLVEGQVPALVLAGRDTRGFSAQFDVPFPWDLGTAVILIGRVNGTAVVYNQALLPSALK